MSAPRSTGQPTPHPLLRRPGTRILVRGVNWLGDAVMTTPALLRLREAAPDARITLLTPEKLRDLWPGHPAVDSIETFTASDSLWHLARRLRPERHDLALILPNSTRSALECFLARIPFRIGYAGNGRSLLLTRAIPRRRAEIRMRKPSRRDILQRLGDARPSAPDAGAIPPEAHHLHQYLHLVAALGADPTPVAPILRVGPGEVREAWAKFHLTPDTPRQPLLGLNPGAEYGPAKRWPRERFVEAARVLRERTGCRWLIFGGRADQSLAGEIAVAIDPTGDAAINLAGRTSLRELCALLGTCRVLLTNDTGPMHVAAALGTPVVVPFGSTSPELTGPGLPGAPRHALLKSSAPCAPCFLRECPVDFRCMREITVGRVVAAIEAALASAPHGA